MTPVAGDSAWAPLLGLLPPDVGRSLGPWLDQLAAAVGPLRARARTGAGAPDGFDGLSLRGPYDRLVLSEWALAEVMPEEFVRRAAQGEHAFYQLARRDEARAKTSVALFDPGPLQLGAPRIGQFAALLVLASRARAAGATFGWATLQRPPEQSDAATGLWLGLDPTDLRSFLVGRTAFAPTGADLDGWFERARRGDWEDLWIVGAPGTIAPGRRLAGVKTPVGRIEIADVFEDGARALDVAVVRGPHRRALRLALPPETQCLQLLRGGLAEPPPPPRPVPLGRTPGVARPVGAPVLLADGRKVAFLDEGGSVTIYTVPDAPSPKRGRYQRFGLAPGDELVGLGWTRRRLVLVTLRDGVLHVADTHGDVLRADASRRPFADPGASLSTARPLAVARVEVLAAGSATVPPSLAFIDADERLVGLHPDRAEVLAARALAAVHVLGKLRVVVPAGGAAPDPTAGAPQTYAYPASAAVIATSGPLKVVVAWRASAGGSWCVPQMGSRVTPVTLVGGNEVLGVTPSPKAPFDLALLTLRADRRALLWSTDVDRGLVVELDRPARHATASARGDRAALVYGDGSLEVWGLPKPQCLLRVAAPA